MIPRFPLAWLIFAACTGKEPECSAEIPCANIAETCQGDVCVTKRCANSSQCPMESYCNGGDCFAGCVEEGDCYPGSTCDIETKTCLEDACTNTEIDCDYREFCNTATGDCYDAGSQYCNFCNYEPGECGDDRNICYAHYCGVDCSEGQPCPSGFECSPFTDEVGNIVTYQCFTYCWLYEGVEPGGPVKGGLRPLGPLPYPESRVGVSE